MDFVINVVDQIMETNNNAATTINKVEVAVVLNKDNNKECALAVLKTPLSISAKRTLISLLLVSASSQYAMPQPGSSSSSP